MSCSEAASQVGGSNLAHQPGCNLSCCVSAGGPSSSSEAALPVDPQEVEDFDAFTQKFWAALKSRTHKVRAEMGFPFSQGSV